MKRMFKKLFFNYITKTIKVREQSTLKKIFEEQFSKKTLNISDSLSNNYCYDLYK